MSIFVLMSNYLFNFFISITSAIEILFTELADFYPFVTPVRSSSSPHEKIQ